MGRSGPRGGGHHMHLSAVAVAYMNAVEMFVGGAWRPISGERRWPIFKAREQVALEIKWFRCYAAGDLDKRLGILLDALQGTLYAKDSQVVEIHAFRLDVQAPEGWIELRAWLAGVP